MERPLDQLSADTLEQVISALGGGHDIRQLVLTTYSLGVQDGQIKALDNANAQAERLHAHH